MLPESIYASFMKKAEAFLELKIDGLEAIEVREFSATLNALASQYEHFVDLAYGSAVEDSRFFIKEIRKGSFVVEFAALSVGIMDQVIILKQFFGLTKTYISGMIAGKKTPQEVRERDHQVVDMVRAIADSEDATLSLAYKETKGDQGNSETVLIVTKQEAKDLVSTFGPKSENNILLEDPQSSFESEPKRVLMRLYQHNQDPNAGNKERTGHKAIIRSLDEKPKTLNYQDLERADELADIVSGNPYQDILFDVTVIEQREGQKLMGYRLVEIHNWSIEPEEL